jgi:hypothetical protein
MGEEMQRLVKKRYFGQLLEDGICKRCPTVVALELQILLSAVM